MAMNPWVSSDIASARAADVERAVARAQLRAEARRSSTVETHRRGSRPPVRRLVARRVGGLLITAGARLVGPEISSSRLRDV